MSFSKTEGKRKGRGVENPGGNTGWVFVGGGNNLASLLLLPYRLQLICQELPLPLFTHVPKIYLLGN
jgi:hypothetical protein